MGVFDTVVVESGIVLPKFPPDRNGGEVQWQTKDIARPSMRRFKLTEDGRLLREETELREKTPDEKRAEAEEHGFDSWDEFVAFCDDTDTEGLLSRGLSPTEPRQQTVDEEFWADHNMHGSFEFHGSRDDIEGGFFWSYEARFTRGDLDALVFLGERGGGGPDTFKPDKNDVVRF